MDCKQYTVYMVQCADGKYYIGMTNDIERRIAEHNEGKDLKCFTFKRRPVRLIYTAVFQDIWDAIHWEKRIKRWGRSKKKALTDDDTVTLTYLSRSTYRKRIDFMVRRAHHDIENALPPGEGNDGNLGKRNFSSIEEYHPFSKSV